MRLGFRLRATLLALGTLGLRAGAADAQRLPLIDPLHLQLLNQEISGDASYEHIRHMTRFHRPRGGSDGLWTVAEYVARTAREYGLEDVRVIRQAATTRPWNARSADLWIEGERPERLASTLQTPLHLADYSRSADATAELVFVGGGGPAELDAAGVAGRIVLTHGPIAQVMAEAVVARGALGAVWYPDPYTPTSGTVGGGLDHPDQLRWLTLPAGQVSGGEPTFAFNLSTRQGVELRNRLAAARAPVRVRARVDARFGSEQGDEPWQVMVEAFVRGSDPGAGQDVVLTAHLQEEGFSANDDASGSANVLEIGRAITLLIAEGRLPRPRRDLRLWWVTEIASQRQFFADHPEAHRRMWVNVNQDMVGANQAQDVMRKQNVTRLPATRFHFLNDVMESVVEHMVAANTFELAQAQAGIPLYPNPHLARLGTMHRYNAEAIFFHYNTDHMPFNEAPIGVPGISFTNMPDRYIHSSDDDLWNIDRTQLGRNAVSAALIAYIMAAAEPADFERLAAEVVGRGAERLGRNLRLGLGWLAAGGDRRAAYFHALDQVRYAADRERLALRSLAQLGPGLDDSVRPLLAGLDRREAQAVRELDLAYQRAAGQRPPARAPCGAEQMLAGTRPALAAGPREFLNGRGQIQGVAGLHPLMAAEVLNAVDGARTGLEIYRYVAAQAREAGDHYYGTVAPGAVLQYLRNVQAAGLLRM
jgi:hypothetical protein